MVNSARFGSQSLVFGAATLALLACSDGNASSDSSARIASKLRSCGLVETSGRLAGWQIESAEDECALDCLTQADCEDLGTEVCGGNDENVSEAYYECFDRCGPFQQLECPTEFDGLSEVERCDGYEDCLDGRDEASCPASAFLQCEGRYSDRVPVVYKCDGELDCSEGEDEQGCSEADSFVCADGKQISASYECDGEPDCDDESDESRCALFACKDGSGMVSTRDVCDLDADCADGSDEEQGCLKLTCSLPLPEDFSALDAPLMSQQKSHKLR